MTTPQAPHVTILLASYEGEKYLQQQLLSIAGQSHNNWSLIISDDGSTDNTLAIIKDFAEARPKEQVRVIEGPKRGATHNFLHLLKNAPKDDILAFSDQDDVWMSDKLARAVDIVAPHKGPAHYAARTIICDMELRPLTGSRSFHRPHGFRNALVQACMAGNTSVYNAPAAAMLQEAVSAAQEADILSHDWWAYQVMAGVGANLHHDKKPVLYYRQHPHSEVGRNDTRKALFSRLQQLLAGDFGEWLTVNQAALRPVRHLFTRKNTRLFDEMENLLTLRGLNAAKQIWDMRLYRQTIAGSFAIYLAGMSGRLKQTQKNSPHT